MWRPLNILLKKIESSLSTDVGSRMFLNRQVIQELLKSLPAVTHRLQPIERKIYQRKGSVKEILHKYFFLKKRDSFKRN